MTQGRAQQLLRRLHVAIPDSNRAKKSAKASILLDTSITPLKTLGIFMWPTTYNRALPRSSSAPVAPPIPLDLVHSPWRMPCISIGSGTPILTMNALSTKLDGIASFISPVLSESQEASLCTHDELWHGAEMIHVSTSFYARQTPI